MTIGLFGDRLARGARATGVGAYIAAMARALGAEPRSHRFVLFSTPERDRVPANVYNPIPAAALPWPRRPVQAAWALAGRPRVRAVGQLQIDLLHVLVPSVPVPTDLPLVATVHDLMPLRFPHFFSRRNRVLFRLAIRQIRRHARRIIAISEATRRDVIELLDVPEERVAVVHYGAPAGFAPPAPAEAAPVLRRYGLDGTQYVLFVGELTHRKNPLRLVRAFAAVARESAEVQLVLAGPPGLGFDGVLDEIDRLRLRDRVVLPGRVPAAALPALMGSASAFVLPSAYEGFGIPALEAMASGTPVVVSDAGSLPEVVGDAGIVVPGDEPETLAAAMGELLEDEPLRRTLVERGRRRVADFSWERAAAQTIEVYEDVLGG